LLGVNIPVDADGLVDRRANETAFDMSPPYAVPTKINVKFALKPDTARRDRRPVKLWPPAVRPATGGEISNG